MFSGHIAVCLLLLVHVALCASSRWPEEGASPSIHISAIVLVACKLLLLLLLLVNQCLHTIEIVRVLIANSVCIGICHLSVTILLLVESIVAVDWSVSRRGSSLARSCRSTRSTSISISIIGVVAECLDLVSGWLT